MKARDWFRFKNVAEDPTVAEIHVIDIIGDWIDELINEFWGMKATLTAKAFIDQLSKLDAGVKTIRVHINSPGGDVFAALTIANALRDQQMSKGRTVETIVDGLAASAASIIAMAGKTVSMADNAILMIHKPLTGLWGNATALRAAAAELDSIEQNGIVQTYKWHTSLDDAEILALLAGENGADGTWMGADEALEKGFVTDVVKGLQAAASIDSGVRAQLRIPEKYRDRVNAFIKTPPAAPAAASALEIVRACKTGGCPEIADELLVAGATLEQAQTKIAATKAARAAEDTRRREITALCERAKLPEFASTYITHGLSVDAVRAQLAVFAAKLDKVEIETGIKPDQGTRSKNVLDTTAIYRDRAAARH